MSGGIMSGLQLVDEPRPCDFPVALHGNHRNPQDLRDLFLVKSRKKPQLDDVRGSRVSPLESRQGIVEHEQVFALRRRLQILGDRR